MSNVVRSRLDASCVVRRDSGVAFSQNFPHLIIETVTQNSKEGQAGPSYRVGRGPRYSLEATRSSGGQPTSCSSVALGSAGSACYIRVGLRLKLRVRVSVRIRVRVRVIPLGSGSGSGSGLGLGLAADLPELVVVARAARVRIRFRVS